MRPKDFWKAVDSFSDNPEPSATIIMSDGERLTGIIRAGAYGHMANWTPMTTYLTARDGVDWIIDIRHIARFKMPGDQP